MKKRWPYVATSTALIAISSPLYAQPEVQAQQPDQVASDEILVTAQRRTERTQDVPISITNISSEALEQANVQELSDVAQLSPATRFDYSAAFVQPSIRGVGTAVVTSGGGANVGIYTDGFYSPNPLAADFQLLNVESIQILKGPQGTLFGRNTTGGAILITTSKPSQELRAITELAYERFNTTRAQAYVSGGVAEGIAVDLEGGYMRSDGFVRNLAPGGDPDLGGYNNWSVRAGLSVELSDSVSFLARYSHRRVDDGTNTSGGILIQDGITYANTKPPVFPASQFPTGVREVSTDEPTGFRLKSDIFHLTGNADLAFADLTSYTQYRKEDALTYLDQDAGPLRLVSVLFPVLNRTFTQELILTSKPGRRLAWTAGAFYFRNRDTFDKAALSFGGSPFFPFAGSSSVVTSIAGFVDMTYQITDRLFVTGGARYSHDKFGEASQFNLAIGTVNVADVVSERVTPRFVLRYELDDETSIYGSFTRGFKAPLIDLARETGPAPVAAETMDAFEAGIKHSQRGLSFNLAAWYYKYQDLQVTSYAPGGAGANLSRIDNAATARIYGVEGDIRYQITPDFSITAAAAYVNARYEQFPLSSRRMFDSSGMIVPQVPFDSSGLRLQRSPEFTASASARYEADLAGGRLGLSTNAYYSSTVFFDAAEQFRQDGYGLVGVRIDWTDPSDQLTLAVYGENVTGTDYLRQFNIGGLAATYGAPATWGASLRYKFGG